MIDKKPSIEVTSFACGECKARHDVKGAADVCCVCSRCKKRLVLRHGTRYGQEHCAHCIRLDRERAARESVKRAKKNLESAEAMLRGTLADDAHD